MYYSQPFIFLFNSQKSNSYKSLGVNSVAFIFISPKAPPCSNTAVANELQV